ncbi:MAG: hypothetical protein HZA50_18600 [Planctomycetes bacterium]|nr:hypothetical protein [Planctomycetota bacterium]
MVRYIALLSSLTTLISVQISCVQTYPSQEPSFDQHMESLRSLWLDKLKEPACRSDYDMISYSEFPHRKKVFPGIESTICDIIGYRLWRGTYRDVPMALYSSLLVGGMCIEYGKTRSACDLSIILAVEQRAKTDRPEDELKITAIPVDSKRYDSSSLDMSNLISGSMYKAEPGQLVLEIIDNGNGRLGFKSTAIKAL